MERRAPSTGDNDPTSVGRVHGRARTGSPREFRSTPDPEGRSVGRSAGIYFAGTRPSGRGGSRDSRVIIAVGTRGAHPKHIITSRLAAATRRNSSRFSDWNTHARARARERGAAAEATLSRRTESGSRLRAGSDRCTRRCAALRYVAGFPLDVTWRNNARLRGTTVKRTVHGRGPTRTMQQQQPQPRAYHVYLGARDM